MFKIVIFLVSIASALAKPGLLHGVAAPVIAPTAVSQQTRHDIIHPGVITYTTAHAAPVVAAAPVAVAAPAVRVSSAATSSFDVRRPAVVAAAPVAVGVVGHAGGYAGGLGYGGAGLGLGGAGLGLGGVGLGLGGVGLGLGGGLGHGLHGYGK